MSCPIRNLAIIPVRTGSKRLPNKNTRDFFGKPLFVHTLEYARDSGLFDNILVSTESREVADLSTSFGFPVPHLRPEQLASDTATLVDVCLHVLQHMEKGGVFYDFFCLLQATSPMRTDQDIKKAYALIDEGTNGVWAVTDFNIPPFWALRSDDNLYVEPLYPQYHGMKSQQFPKAVVDSGSMYWMRVSSFKEHKSLSPPRVKGYWMPRFYSVDVDEASDWDEMEVFYKEFFLKRTF